VSTVPTSQARFICAAADSRVLRYCRTGENAGVVDIGDGFGAASKWNRTIIRVTSSRLPGRGDRVGGFYAIFTMGARPIARARFAAVGPITSGASGALNALAIASAEDVAAKAGHTKPSYASIEAPDASWIIGYFGGFPMPAGIHVAKFGGGLLPPTDRTQRGFSP